MSQVIDELIKEVVRNVQPIVLPNVLSKPSIMFIFVMISEPELGGPVQVSQIKWLYGVEISLQPYELVILIPGWLASKHFVHVVLESVTHVEEPRHLPE